MAQIDIATEASPVTPAAGRAAFYFDAAATPKYKDSTGAIHSMGGLSGWYDVTSYGVLASNSASANVTALNLLLATTAPSGSVIYFPPGIYQFNAALTTLAKPFIFQGVGGSRSTGGFATAYTEIQVTTNLSGNFITLSGSGLSWYTEFHDLTFTTNAVQSAGACIATGNNVGTNFVNCAFQGVVPGGTNTTTNWLNCIDYTGANGGNSAIVRECTFNEFTGSGIVLNGSGSSLVVVNCVIQGQYGPTTASAAVAGINCRVVGALQLDNSDVLGAVNNLLVSPQSGEVAASVYCTNTYFDSSSGSCIKITNVGATVRCKFESCSFTTNTSSTGFSAVELSSTFAYTASGQGIDFVNCNVLNTFGTTGTTNGFLISGTADFSILGCRIAGWTNGIQVTPIATAGRTKPNIQNNTIGPCGGYPANTTGVLLNAGSAAYGAILIADNMLQGNTTPVTDSSTATGATITTKAFVNNTGMSTGSASLAAGVAITTTTKTQIVSIPIPANSLRVGTQFRVKVAGNRSAVATASILNVIPQFGVNNTTSDTPLPLLVPTFTAVAAVQNFVAEAVLTVRALGNGSTSIVQDGWAFVNPAGQTAAAPVSMQISGAATAVSTLNSTADSFLSLAITLGTAVSTVTVTSASIEVVNP